MLGLKLIHVNKRGPGVSLREAVGLIKELAVCLCRVVYNIVLYWDAINREYLISLSDACQHDNFRDPFLPDHLPEVTDRIVLGALGEDNKNCVIITKFVEVWEWKEKLLISKIIFWYQ